MESTRPSTSSSTRAAAAVLAALGAVSGLPLALAQLDYAGAVDVFGIDAGGTAHGLLVLVGVSGALTLAVVLTALAGAALCVAGSPTARPLLIAAAAAGFATALLLWLPSAVTLAAAAVLSDRKETSMSPSEPRDALGAR